MNEITERLLHLCDMKGVLPTNALKDLEMSTSAFTEWKKGKASPGLNPLIKFSKYFGVSLDYIVFGTEQNGGKLLEFSNPREAAFVRKFNELPSNLQDNVLTYMEGMLAASSVSTESRGKKSLA